MWPPSPTCRGVMRLLGLTNFASMALPLTRLHSHPYSSGFKENYKTPVNLFKGLKGRPRGFSGPALVAHTQATKPICKSLIEEVVTTDASNEGYGGHMDNLSFRRGRLSPSR